MTEKQFNYAVNLAELLKIDFIFYEQTGQECDRRSIEMHLKMLEELMKEI